MLYSHLRILHIKKQRHARPLCPPPRDRERDIESQSVRASVPPPAAWTTPAAAGRGRRRCVRGEGKAHAREREGQARGVCPAFLSPSSTHPRSLPFRCAPSHTGGRPADGAGRHVRPQILERHRAGKGERGGAEERKTSEQRVPQRATAGAAPPFFFFPLSLSRRATPHPFPS